MTLTEKIKEATAPYQLLNHPFYQDWNQGKLSKETIKKYAGQYFFHVDCFPRYISATHSNCERLDHRKILLENLNEEDGMQAKAHIDLWGQFCKALGYDSKELGNEEKFESIDILIATFFKFARSSYEEGLSSLYSYERQVPEIAETKIEGLKKYYDIDQKEDLAFFSVHKEADIFHRKACETLLNQIAIEDHEKCVQAAVASSKALWQFLSQAHELEEVA